MTGNLDFISANDKPVLIAFSSPQWLDTVRSALQELGYKVHTAATHGDFSIRFGQVHYQIVVVEELFCAATLAENQTLKELQKMPMSQRRHATVMLVGGSFKTFDPQEAFQLSVHAVINGSELILFKQLVEKAVADNALFLRNFLKIQDRVRTSGHA